MEAIRVDFIKKITITYTEEEFEEYIQEYEEENGYKPTKEQYEDMLVDAYMEDKLKFIPDEIIKYSKFWRALDE